MTEDSGRAPPPTPEEQLGADLETAFPEARPDDVVEFRGKRYVRRFTAVGYDRTAKKKWQGTWQELPAGEPRTKE